MSKFVRGIFVLSMLILTAGVFCLVPNSFIGAKAEENVQSEVSENANEKVEKEKSMVSLLDSLTVESISLETTSLYGHESVYRIQSEDDLAYVAYMVNSGDETFINGVYVLETDLDLIGSLWTPIGTYKNNFKGTFYGNGHSISNITINDASVDSNGSSCVGLFGNVAGASICDVILRGSMVYNTSRIKGSLVGSLLNSEIINCYDESSKVGYNGAEFSLSVGTQTNSYVFRGGSYDGKNTVYTTTYSINSTIIASGVNSGYVGFYVLTEGEYVNADDSNTYWHNKTQVRVLLNTSLQPFSAYNPINNLYRVSAPVLRENASAGDVWIKRTGYKAIIPLTTALKVENSFIAEIQFNSNQTISVYLNFGYGTNRSGYYVLKYDQNFYDYFNENPYMKIRAGYDFEGLYSHSSDFVDANKMETEDENNIHFKKAFPTAYSTYYYSWIAEENKNVYFDFAIAVDEGGVFTNSTALGGAIETTSFAIAENEGMTLSTTSYSNKRSLEVEGITSGEEVSLSFKLKTGFAIKSLDNNESTIMLNGNLQADSESGIYVNFINETGLGSDYYVDSYTNNDSYNKANAICTYDEETGLYTINVNNIVGENGVVYIVVGRVEYEINLTPTFVKEANESDIGYAWSLVDGGDLVSSIYGVASLEENTLFVKRDETPLLKITTNLNSESSGVIIAIASYSGMQTQPQQISTEDSKLNYFMTWTIECGQIWNNGHLTMRLGYLKTRVTVQSVDGEGRILDSENSMCDGLGTIINGSSAYFNNSDGYFVSMNSADRVEVKNNGFYYATKVEVRNLSNNTTQTLNLVDNLSTSEWTGNAFLAIYDGTGVNYSVKVFFEFRTYDITYEFYFNGVKQVATENLITVTNSTNLADLDPNTVVDISIALSNLGKGVLFVPTLAVELEQDIQEGAVGFRESSIIRNTSQNGVFDYDLTIGTYDTTVKFYFEFRKVEFNINKLQLLAKDGSSAELSSGIIPINPTLTFDYNFASGTARLTGEIDGLSIHSQYYLLGWYLKNGEIVESANYANLLTNESIVADVAGVGAQNATENAQSFSYNGVNAFVQARVVNVKETTGTEGNGRFYLNDKTTVVAEGYEVDGGSVTYGEKLTLANDVFFNLGHTFSSWRVPEFCGSIESGNYSIKDSNWFVLFRTANDGSSVNIDESGYQTWTGFSSLDKETRSVVITAQWSVIEYSIRVDDNASAIVKIGETISYTTVQENRDGQAQYIIGSKQVYGSTKNGYVVVGYTLAHEGGNSLLQEGEYHLSQDNFLAFINHANRFEINEQPISITTMRDAGTYKIYLDNSANGYYRYSWSESNNNGFGGIENGVIFIYATFDSKPENLDKAIESGALSITRTGYSANGWAMSNGGVQTTIFDASLNYTYLRDINLVPTWALDSQTAKSEIEFGDDATNLKEFYLTNSHDILFGGISGENVSEGNNVTDANFVLANGETVVDYGFVVYANGQTQTYSKESVLNIDIFSYAGEVSVQFYITLRDTLNKSPVIQYTANSDTVAFTMKKNSIYFYDFDLHSIYNGTAEFVPTTIENYGIQNEFGAFLYRYDWNGADRAQDSELVEIGQTEEFFNDFSIMGADYNAGIGKSLRMGLNSNKFANLNPLDIFENVMQDDNGNYVVLESALTIEKAIITIAFPNGSAYKFDNVVTVVYTNTAPSQFSVGAVTFTYNYDRIILANNLNAGTYQGQENHDTDQKYFIVEGLSVEGHVADLNQNFEWNISKQSSFNLLNANSALKLEYSTRYLTAQNGELNSSLSEVYGGYADRLKISSIKIDGVSQTLPDSNQFSIFIGNEVAISVAGNDSIHLYVYVNKALVGSSNITFTVSVSYVAGHDNLIFPLAWGKDNDATKYSSAFDSDDAGKSSIETALSSSMSNSTTYAVLTDIVKVNLDYNGGKNANEKLNETIFVSANSAISVANPVHTYSGLTFGGYTSPESDKISIVSDGENTTFEAVMGGKAESLKAKWSFSQINAELLDESFNRFASENGIILSIDDIASISSPELFTTKSFLLLSGETAYAFNASSNTFEIKNASGYALPSMSGTYALTLNFVYADGVQAPQTQTKTLEFDLNIIKNTIGVAYNGDKLVFNNSDQSNKVEIDFTLNGENNNSISLTELSTSDLKESIKGVYIFGQPSLTLKNAGDYSITFKVVTSLSEIYQFENNTDETTLSLSIEKYEIVLADYEGEIDLSKVFGETEPNPISAVIVIVENGNDEVALSFSRVEGEGIGSYALSFREILSTEDKNNYFVTTDGFNANFDIVAPSGNLKVELSSKLSYTYNGFAIENFEVSYNGTNYTLSATAGDETVSTTFDLYYLNGSNKVAIPQSQKEKYSQVIMFSTNAEANAGSYNLSVALTDEGVDWKGVDIVNTANAVIKIEKRIISISSFEKMFDQTVNFVYNNVSTDKNTATLILANVVEYTDGSVDEIELSGKISSALTGEVSIIEVSIINSAKENYVLLDTTDLVGKVVADYQTIISANLDQSNFDYGVFMAGMTSEEILNKISLKYNNGEIKNEYISISNVEIKNESVSTGGYLNVGTYSIEFTLSSTNFTFAKALEESLTHEYSTLIVAEIIIEQIEVVITNSTLKITKVYDGNANVLEKFVGQAVNVSGGYFTSTGILAGDEIIIQSGLYNDKSIGSAKEITLTFAEGDDNENYSISTNVVGDITKITLTFNKNGNTITFVDTAQEFANTSSIKVEYTGDFDANLAQILKEENFLVRVGYTQTSWAFDGVDLAQMTTMQKDALLQSAVDGAHAGITLDAVWQINTYTVKVNSGVHASASLTETTLPYYSNIENITVTANAGYTFEGITANQPQNATLSLIGESGNRNGAFSLTHLLGDIEISIEVEEIEVKIILEYNPPMNLGVLTTNASWGNLRERIIKYSELSTTDLPELKVSKEDTFDFSHWTLNGEVNSGATIWERINGNSLLTDNLTGYVFTANWTESELYLTITSSDKAKIFVLDEEGNEIFKGENGYQINYLDDVTIKINHADWYKWKGVSITGDYAQISGDSQATDSNAGEFTLTDIGSHIAITIESEAIKITFTTSYTTPIGTTINQTNGAISGVYADDKGMATMSDVLGVYTAKAGTYRQEKWISSAHEIEFTDNPTEVIELLYGHIPTSDITLSLTAKFVGLAYTVTFDKGMEGGQESSAVFTGTDAGKDVVTRLYIYGSAISDLPVLENGGKDYLWITEANEIFSNGKTFTTSLANADCTLTIVAEWEFIPYKVNIVLGANADKVFGMTADGLEVEDYIEVILGSNQTILFTLATGYEIDTKNTTMTTGNSDTSLTLSENEITVVNVRNETTIFVEVKAKDYTLTINESGYENLSNSKFEVYYSQNITTIFDNESFVRDGYILKALNWGDIAFATKEVDKWSFNEYFVQSGQYVYDDSLVLDAVWEYDASENFISLVTNPVNDVYYNGTEQAIAVTEFTVKSGETFAKNATFENGEKVKDVYYMLNGSRLSSNDEFKLVYKNHLNDAGVYLVAVIEDLISGQSHTIMSAEVEVNLYKSDIVIKDANIISYYTGSSTIQLISGAGYGELYYHDSVTQLSELEIAKVEIIDLSGKFDKGENYSVKYYFNSILGFNESNYSTLTKDGGFFTLTTESMANKVYAEIVETSVTISISGMGYENGKVHKVDASEVVFPDYIQNASAEINSVYTKTATAKIYTNAGDFDIDIAIKSASGDDITDNFKFVISGSYTIRSASYAFEVVASGKYFDIISLTDSDEAIVSVKEVVYAGEYISIGEDVNYMHNSELIFSITSNGTKNLSILVTEGKSVEFHFEVSGNMGVVGWASSTDVEDIKVLLENLESENGRTFSATYSKSTTIYAVVTDFKAILQGLGDKGGNQGYAYIKLGQTATISAPDEWTGFDFIGWDTLGSGLTVSENEATLSADAGIASASIRALWELDLPQATTKSYSFDALIDGELKEITINDILANGIENANEDEITYSFEYLKGSFSLSKESSFKIASLTSSSGTYTLKIVATKEGYVSKTSTFTFDIVVNGLVPTGIEFSENEFVYHNKDYSEEISVAITGTGVDAITLKNLSQENSPYFYFTGLSEIKNVGEYTILLKLDKEVFDLDKIASNFNYSFTFKVNKADLALKQSDIPAEKAEKLLGMEDPDFTFTVPMFEGEYQENVEITLIRAEGESKGDYPFTSITSTSTNFNLSFAENVYFTIKQADSSLKVVIDKTLESEYSKKSPTFTTAYDSTLGKWIMMLGNSSSTLTLLYASGEDFIEISGSLYVIALENITFSLSGAVNAGIYDAKDMAYAGEGNFAKFIIEGKIKITPRALTIQNITKVFDRTDQLKTTSANLAEIIEGDEVSLNGKYKQTTAGNNIALINLSLEGKDSGNYVISNLDATGSITPLAVSSFTFTAVNTTVEYGVVGLSTTLNDILANLGICTLTIDGVTDDLENGFVSVSSITINKNNLSSAGMLKAGNQTLTIMFSTQNFTGLENGSEIVVTITPKQLDLSTLSIAKDFDDNALLPSDISANLNAFILANDKVEIDLANSAYEDKEIGSNKKVTIVLTGQDSANYEVIDNVYGKINAFSIKLEVNATTENNLLVTDGEFVNDGLSPNIKTSLFKVAYPAEISAEEVLASLTFPERVGYNATGWKYLEGEKYVSLTADNIFAFLERISNDSTNTDKKATIYTVWEIEYYSVDVVGEYIESVTISTDNDQSNLIYEENQYKIRYFSNVSIQLKGTRGFKIKSYMLLSGSVSNKDFSDIGNNEGVVTLQRISTRIQLQVTMEEINVTFNIAPNILSAYTSRTDTENLTYTFGYASLAEKGEEDLAHLTVTEGTYKLSGYFYQGTNLIASKTLQEIVDEMNSTLTSDINISLTASWQGERYLITFLPNGGTIEGSNTITATYGSAFVGSFPSVTKEGQHVEWKAPDGRTYKASDVLQTIGTYNAESKVWELTFTAEWQNNDFNLIITFDDKITIKVNDKQIQSGQSFDLTYGGDELIIDVSFESGYSYNLSREDFSGSLTEKGNQFRVKNLTDNSVLRFEKVCNENTLLLEIENVESFAVTVDGEEIVASHEIVAKTESVVEIVFTALKGYEFGGQVTFTGSGQISKTLSEDKTMLTVVWSSFIDGATIELSAGASDNVITINDATDYFLTLTFNGQSVDVGGGTFTVKTGETVNVTGVLKYGFKDGFASTGETNNYVKENSTSSEFSNDDKYYHFTTALEGFNESFVVSFSAVARTYAFEILIKEGMEGYGQITSTSPQYVEFGQKLILSEQELRYDYIFNGWESDGKIISKSKADEITLNESLKDLLESVANGDYIKVYATYIKRTLEATFISGINGAYEILQDDQVIATVGAEKTIVQEIFLGQNVVLRLLPDKGYEVDSIKIDNVLIAIADYGYTEDEKTVSIFESLDDPIYKFEVSFKASQLSVTVQAGTSIRYQEHLGTDAGGYFFASDSRGNKLDNSSYLENDGKLIIGADYKLTSYTDIRLYFVAEAKSGFELSVSASSADVIISESTVDGKKVYSFSGIKENMTIKAIFIAKENIINVQFAVEGEIQKVPAGMIVVDSSSTLVSASPNRGSYLEIGVMTSANLSLEVYSSLAYELLADENGYLMYSIVYTGTNQFDVVRTGLLEVQDRVTTGFTFRSTIEIENINSNATIYIYVVPQEYTIKFAVTEIESFTLAEKVRFGQELNLANLTEEEYYAIFPHREGYTFSGYFTNPLAQGTQYINANNELVRAWYEDGYEFNGHVYVVEEGFDPETNTFTLYAGWIYNKAIITVEFTPPEIELIDESLNITIMIDNINSITTWTSQYSRWYAEILIGSNIQFKAIEFEGYEFVSWRIYFEDGAGVEYPSSFTLFNVQLGTYNIKAYYNPKYKMRIENANTGVAEGGESYLVQDGEKIKGASFARDKYLTLKAKAIEGYKFLYWTNVKSGTVYHGTKDSSGTVSYTFNYLINSPLELKAMFVGKTVVVNLDTSDGGQHHVVREVTINGKSISYQQPFNACVGDEIKVFVSKAQGYGFEFDGAPFKEKYDEATGYYVFSYTFGLTELSEFGHDSYLININFKATKEKLTLKFNSKIEQMADQNEIAKAGSLVYRDVYGKDYEVESGKTYQLSFGDTVRLIINLSTNYQISKIYLKNPIANDITAWLSGNVLVIDLGLVDKYFAREITIDVYFERLVWTMEEFRADTLTGGGTEENPYVITSEEEFALVAYLVNNGIGNGKTKYADCHYVLKSDLDFKGKYWEPIGTKENSFNGTFDLGNFDIKNITHYTTYSNPKTSYGGLFWHLGENAKISQKNNVVVLSLSIVGGIILLLLLILLVILIARKKEKEKREDIANG